MFGLLQLYIHETTVIGENGSDQRAKKFRTSSLSEGKDEKRERKAQKRPRKEHNQHEKPMISSLSPRR